MKKLAILLALLSVLVLTGCASDLEMYIEPAQLNADEQAVADLLKRPASHGPLILDYAVDDALRTITVTGYELKDGRWESVSPGGGLAFDASEGRIALDFDILPEGLGVYIAGGESGGSKSYHDANFEMDMTDLSRLTSVLVDRTSVEYDKEIPVVMQVFDGGNQTYSMDTSDFADPEAIAQHGYAHVYALTVTFSRTPLE